MLRRYVVVLQNISIPQFFVQRICICIWHNGFQDFSVAFADSRDFLVCWFPRSDIRLINCLPCNSSRVSFWSLNSSYVSCNCFKVCCICFHYKFPSWKYFCTSGCSWKSFLIFSRYLDPYRKKLMLPDIKKGKKYLNYL